jgi:hypothetical protein
MLILRVLLVWTMVSVHVVGGAALFRRLFPRESPWFGFIVPALALVVGLNFIEHGIAIPTLQWLLPITFGVCLWQMVSRKTSWSLLWFPTVIFLASFSFTLFLRCLTPDIARVRDGVIDLHFISDFCMGQTLPPESTWVSGLKLQYYYAFPHYAASVLIRLLGLDIGTGFNTSSALVSAFVYFLIGAIAWRIGKRRYWIVAVSIVLTASAMAGSTPFLWLFEPYFKEPIDTTVLLNHADGSGHYFPFDNLLHPISYNYGTHELIPPGYYTWIGSFHSVTVGQFIILFLVFCLVEMTRMRRADFPWIGSIGGCLLLIVCSTWGLPEGVFMLLAGAGWCACKRIHPHDWRAVTLGVGLLVLCLSPMLLDFLLTRAPSLEANVGDGRTQLFEFVIQWWPLYLPWAALLFYWKELPPAVRFIQVMLPSGFLWVEFSNLSNRLDMTGKLWGFIFVAGWAVLIPALCASRHLIPRVILGLLLVGGVFSTCFWIDYEHRMFVPDDLWRLNGKGEFRSDYAKGRMFNVLSTLKHQIIIPGKSIWAYDESPMLASLTGNRNYVAWAYFSDQVFYPNSYGEAAKREIEINDLYDGKNPDPLTFLRQRNIEAVVVWPGNRISDDALSKLKTQLAPEYRYEDCRNIPATNAAPNAGVFIDYVKSPDSH